MTRLRNAILAVATLLLLTASPAAAITYGTRDYETHPYVGFTIFFVPSEESWFSCSGTLLAPTVFLTAGHCTVDIGTNGADTGSRSGGTDVWVTFRDHDVLGGWPQRADYPDVASLYAARSSWLNDPAHGFIRGTSHPDPAYDDFAEFPVDNDLGIVTLSTPAPVDEFGVLAPLGTVDRMAAKASTRNDALLQTVGYGDRNLPRQTEDATRYWSTSRIVEVNGHASQGGNLHTLNNISPIGGTGGSCFGDSGGPLFVNTTNQIVSVVSFGYSGTCHGADYSWRVDIPSSRAFIESWLR
ncbi:MAG TPA: trypsin-like serine protease [Candidatus Limnocylindrales bacterium]|nr:trypsin-like serine protease [Candidatus Limnocylindrales bacterium]